MFLQNVARARICLDIQPKSVLDAHGSSRASLWIDYSGVRGCSHFFPCEAPTEFPVCVPLVGKSMVSTGRSRGLWAETFQHVLVVMISDEVGPSCCPVPWHHGGKDRRGLSGRQSEKLPTGPGPHEGGTVGESSHCGSAGPRTRRGFSVLRSVPAALQCTSARPRMKGSVHVRKPHREPVRIADR